MKGYKPTCVILHLYYPELWQYISNYLKNITTDFDLYISTTIDFDEKYGFIPQKKFVDVENIIKSEYPQAKIYKLENKGMDIAPFIYIMNDIIPNTTYDVIIKLHTKKSLIDNPDGTITEIGNEWRNNLYNALLINKDVFEFNFNVIKTTNHKMVASTYHIQTTHCYGWENLYITKEIPQEIQYDFVMGTIFMVDFNIIKNWMQDEAIFQNFYHKFLTGYIGNNTIAHHIERVFGLLISLDNSYILKNSL